MTAYKLTYSTMFDPPEEMHERFEEALAGVRQGLGSCHAMFIDGRDAQGVRTVATGNPVDERVVLGRFSAGDASHVDAAVAADQGFRFLKAPVKRVCLPDTPVAASPASRTGRASSRLSRPRLESS